ncbi:MAG: transcriptional regulator [Candidatus Marinimicrobia bacterium]|jgi:DNA-binding MarR family transcriptional regulator|nr:transcriptional regulator [Candidatus Neomarinimicrobiota bacterium]
MSTFDELDPLIHSRIRLSILSILMPVKEVEFVYLKETIGTTDGNLSTHLTKLEEAGYITIKKEFVNKRPRTTCQLSSKGRAAFIQYVETLNKFIHPENNDDSDNK